LTHESDGGVPYVWSVCSTLDGRLARAKREITLMTRVESKNTILSHGKQRSQSPWATLASIWRNRYPPERPQVESFSLAVKLAVTPVLVIRRLSPSTLLRSRSPNVVDAMVIAWTLSTVLLLTFLHRRSPTDTAPLMWTAISIYAWFRLIDTTSQKLMELLVHSVRPPLLAGVQRSIVLGVLNLIEIVACYSVLYLANGGILHDSEGLPTATAAFYFSTVTALTVGYGDFVPTTDGARALVVSEIVVVAIFVIAWFPRVVSMLFPARGE